jgi:hypothetical protein
MKLVLSASLFGISLLGWISLSAYPAVAQNLSDFFNNLAASQGNTSAQEQQATKAAADGMQLLAHLMEQNGYDRQRAWMAFAQSSEGQRIMRVPGALSLLTDWFNSVMALPSGPGRTIDPARTRSQSPSNPPENRGQASNGNGTAPNADLVQPRSGQKVFNASECIGPIIMGVCQGSILPNQAYHPTCYGQMLNGNCTGPMF